MKKNIIGIQKNMLGEGRKEGGREGKGREGKRSEAKRREGEGREGRKEGRKQGKQQIRKLQLHHIVRAMRNSRSSQTPVSLRIAELMRNLEKTVFASKMLIFD